MRAKSISFIRRNRVINKLYGWFLFLKSIRLKDFLHINNLKKIKLIFIVKPYTMLWYPRLSKLYAIASYLEINKIQGDFVECGVWNGGSAGIIASIAKDNKNRNIYLFDSWEGQPTPTKWDINYKGLQAEKGMDLGIKEKVEELLFRRLKLDNKGIHLIKGWLNETLPFYKNKIGEIALLHLDCDLYQSVKFCLEILYPNLISGGFVVIDDYGYWRGCKKAVDEFIEENKLKINLIKIDYTGVYFRKK